MIDRQLAFDVDVPEVPAAESRGKRQPTRRENRVDPTDVLRAFARQKALVEQLDGRGVVVDLWRWRRDRRAA